MKRIKILAVSGTSGGHIFPVFAFLDTLKDRHSEIETLLVLPKTNIKEQIKNSGYNLDYISISSVKFNLKFKNMLAAFGFIKGFFESLLILLRFRPNVAVGFGSLTCIPMIFLARVLGIKTLIHEQNVIPGRANRLMAWFSDRVAVSFRETRGYLKGLQRKIVLTGNPIRNGMLKLGKKEALDFFGFSPDKFTVLVMGGSLGSHNINMAFLRALENIHDRSKLQVVHLAGSKDYGELEKNYKDLDSNIRLYSFLKPMQYAYSACDIAISRAGATTIAEIIHFGVPAIIIPYPYAYHHQVDNARVLKRIGSCEVIEDERLDKGVLGEVLNGLINNPGRLEQMRSCYNNLPILDANSLLVDEVLSLYNK